ncbi:hypothetical protein SRHO_G00201360 [Serrasalmus rhombeus]
MLQNTSGLQSARDRMGLDPDVGGAPYPELQHPAVFSKALCHIWLLPSHSGLSTHFLSDSALILMACVLGLVNKAFPCITSKSHHVFDACCNAPRVLPGQESCRISTWCSWDMPSQQGVTSDLLRLAGSRGSLGKIWGLRGRTTRQGNCHGEAVCGFDIRRVALQEAEVHGRRNHLLIICDAELP